MKKFSLLLCLTVLLFASCIQDEAPNAEADITSCTLANGELKRPAIIENDRITLIVDRSTDLSELAPLFELTPGATITPENGSKHNFILPQTYTVTSEDKKWQKEYTVIASYGKELPTSFAFEGVTIKEGSKYHYHVIQEVDEAQSVTLDWASGNSAFTMAASMDGLENNPTVFPTYSSENGRHGKCAVMVTRKPQNNLVTVFAKIAAGNLFTGVFDLKGSNLSESATATHFGAGCVFYQKPVSLEGYYKYKAGPKMTITKELGGKDYSNYKDTWDIYGILYDASQKPYLDGYNVLSDPSIVLIARLPYEERTESDDWKHFFIEFQPFEGGTPFDAEKLKNGDYNLAIVMSSSEEGAYFNGAENSTLYVDDVELKYTEDF